MKIAFIGKICSGKTWCVDYLNEKSGGGFYVTRFAKMVKKIARELFFMREKDRHLLQQIGTKMREIHPDVYANYVIQECRGMDMCLLDDARYVNEIEALKRDGWTLVKLEISSKLQRERIIRCYPHTYEEHLSRLTHDSETQQDLVGDDVYDYIINNDKDDIINCLDNIYDELRRRGD